MKNVFSLVSCLFLAMFFASHLSAQTANEISDKIAQDDAKGRVSVISNTTDACDKNNDLKFETAYGDLIVKAGETKYFKVRKDDDYGRSGGYKWHCAGSNDKSRLDGALYIKVVRKADTGAFQQFKIDIIPY